MYPKLRVVFSFSPSFSVQEPPFVCHDNYIWANILAHLTSFPRMDRIASYLSFLNHVYPAPLDPLARDSMKDHLPQLYQMYHDNFVLVPDPAQLQAWVQSWSTKHSTNYDRLIKVVYLKVRRRTQKDVQCPSPYETVTTFLEHRMGSSDQLSVQRSPTVTKGPSTITNGHQLSMGVNPGDAPEPQGSATAALDRTQALQIESAMLAQVQAVVDAVHEFRNLTSSGLNPRPCSSEVHEQDRGQSLASMVQDLAPMLSQVQQIQDAQRMLRDWEPTEHLFRVQDAGAMPQEVVAHRLKIQQQIDVFDKAIYIQSERS